MGRARGTDSARVVQVIETKALRGAGTEEDMCRVVTQYWDFEGNLLAESDECKKGVTDEPERRKGKAWVLKTFPLFY